MTRGGSELGSEGWCVYDEDRAPHARRGKRATPPREGRAAVPVAALTPGGELTVVGFVFSSM